MAAAGRVNSAKGSSVRADVGFAEAVALRVERAKTANNAKWRRENIVED